MRGTSELCPGPGRWLARLSVRLGRVIREIAGQRFSCQDGQCPISGASVFSPVAERSRWSAAIAQLVEHVIRNDGVTGSNPVCGTKQILLSAAITCRS